MVHMRKKKEKKIHTSTPHVCIYRTTSYLCDPEICVFWQKKPRLFVDFIYAWGMAIFTIDIHVHYVNYIMQFHIIA